MGFKFVSSIEFIWKIKWNVLFFFFFSMLKCWNERLIFFFLLFILGTLFFVDWQNDHVKTCGWTEDEWNRMEHKTWTTSERAWRTTILRKIAGKSRIYVHARGIADGSDRQSFDEHLKRITISFFYVFFFFFIWLFSHFSFRKFYILVFIFFNVQQTLTRPVEHYIYILNALITIKNFVLSNFFFYF